MMLINHYTFHTPHFTLVFSVHLFGVGDSGAEVFAVHLGDVIDGDTLRACSLAFVKVRAVAEAFLVHLSDHGENALLGLDITARLS